MSKLKKVLSLMLAAAMILGMMLIPASAAQFKDADQITYTEEVAITAGLGLFAGADGNFMPKDTVTRAQMATIIVKMLHGADANADAFKGTNGGFSDTASFEGGWAEGYINWCASLGIVKGYGDGTFKPGNKVTAAEAVTMILNALKIDAGEGTWPVTVMAKAEEVKFFEDLKQKPTSDKAMSREELAVVSLAGLEYSPEGKTGYLYDGKVYDNYMDALLIAGDATKIEPAANDTLATKVYELKTAEGFIAGNQATGLEYTQLMDGKIFDIETGLDQIGHFVTVYYKELYETEEKPGVTYAVSDECAVVTVDEEIDTAKEYKAAFGKTYSKNTGILLLDGQYNIADPATGSIAGYDGGAAAPAGTYTIHKGNIVSYMEPVDVFVGYVIERNTYPGTESIYISGANNESPIPNTEGDDQIREYKSLAAGDYVTYVMAQGIYVVQPIDPVPGVITRTTTNEDGRAVITLSGYEFVEFDGDRSGIAGKLSTNVGTIDFGQTYDLYVTMDDEFVGWKKAAGSAAASIDNIIYSQGVLEISEKDSYGKNVINYKARGVNMNGGEVLVLVGKVFDDNNNKQADPGEQVLGSTVTGTNTGFFTVEDSTDKDAKKEGIQVLAPVAAVYDGNEGSVFAIKSLPIAGKRGFFSNGWVPFYSTTAGIEAYGTTGSKYIFLGSGLYDPEFDAEFVTTVSNLDQSAASYDMLVTRGPNGASNLISVLVVNQSATAVESGKTVYLSAQQIADASRNADGVEYQAYVGNTGEIITLTSENALAVDAAPGFYRANTDKDGITTFTAFESNAKTGADNDYLRQNMGIQGLVQGRSLAAYNVTDGVIAGTPGLGTNSSSGAMVVVDIRSEEEVEASQTGLIANATQMFDLMERDPSRFIIADLYLSQNGTNNPVVETIFVKNVVRSTPGIGTVLYSPGTPDASAEDAELIVVKNSAGTDTGRTMKVDYGFVTDALDVEGFFTYGVNTSGELSLDRLTVDKAAPGFYGMHNQVTAINAAAGTLTTEDYHAACDVACMHSNEAFRGDMTVTEQTQIFDADGSKITMDELAAKFASGELFINYFCNGGPNDSSVELIFVVDAVKPGVEIHKHGANCTHGHAGLQADWQPLSKLTDGMTASVVLTDGMHVYLDKDITVTSAASTLQFKGEVYLCLNGHNLTSNTTAGNIIYGNNGGGTLNICDCSEGETGTIGKGRTASGATSGPIIVRATAPAVSTVNLYAGSITGSTAGQMVYVNKGCTFNMYGGQITGNTASVNGAVHVAADATFNMYGGEIGDNDVATTQVTTAGSSSVVNIQGGTVTENAPPPPAAYTHTCTHNHADWSGLQWTKLEDVLVSGGNTTLPSGNYYLEGDVTLEGYIQVTAANANINLCLNGHALKGAAGKGYMMYVNTTGATINICDSSANESGTIGDGWTSTTNASGSTNRTYSVIRLGAANKGGNTLNLYAGSFTGATAGSIIYVNNVTTMNTFNMYGGSITGNTCPGAGGTAVYNRGVFNMYGGEISNNTVNEATSRGAITTDFATTGQTNIYGGIVLTTKSQAPVSLAGGTVTITGGQFNVAPKDTFVPATHEIKAGGTYGYTVSAK